MTDRVDCAETWFFVYLFVAILGKLHTPLANRLMGCLERSGEIQVGLAFRCQEHDPCSKRKTLTDLRPLDSRFSFYPSISDSSDATARFATTTIFLK